MQVTTQAAHDVNADILVIQMGSNGGWDSYDELIAQYQAMIEKSGTQCYIIIGDTDNPTEAYDSEQYESDIEVGTKDNVGNGIEGSIWRTLYQYESLYDRTWT